MDEGGEEANHAHLAQAKAEREVKKAKSSWDDAYKQAIVGASSSDIVCSELRRDSRLREMASETAPMRPRRSMHHGSCWSGETLSSSPPTGRPVLRSLRAGEKRCSPIRRMNVAICRSSSGHASEQTRAHAQMTTTK